MAIEDRKVVTFHYTLSNAGGKELESSRGGDPLVYLHGYRNIIPGLEQAEFVRFGQMHRNTFINSPRLLRPSRHPPTPAGRSRRLLPTGRQGCRTALPGC